MGISDIHVFPITITCLLQGTLCDTGIPCTFYGENICSVPKNLGLGLNSQPCSEDYFLSLGVRSP